jgi:hypothetical protein
MNGWMNGKADRWMNGKVDRQMDGWVGREEARKEGRLALTIGHLSQSFAERAIDQKRLEEVRGGTPDASDRRGMPSERPVDRRMEEVKAGGTQNNGAPGLDRTQIHVMSPGIEGKERASIITVSTRQGGEMGMGMGSAVGIHRAKRAGDDEHVHSPAVDSTAARRTHAGKGESPSVSRDSAVGRNLASYVQVRCLPLDPKPQTLNPEP